MKEKKSISYKTNNENLYDRIKQIMKARKITRKELSEKIGVSYNTLTTMFQRESMNIDINTIKKISDYLNTTIEYLVSGQNVNLSELDHIKNFPPYTITINLETSSSTTTLLPHQAHTIHDLVMSYAMNNVINEAKKDK